MLVNDQSVEFMNENIELVFTLDLIMLLVKYLLFNFLVSYLLGHWENQNHSNDDYDRLALIIDTLKSLCQEDVK
jgi:hypothetical protein